MYQSQSALTVGFNPTLVAEARRSRPRVMAGTSAVGHVFAGSLTYFHVTIHLQW